MIRKKKLFARPLKLYEKQRILEENELVNKYGLKNKRAIWKALAKVNYFRKRAMALARASADEQNVFFSKLNNIGLNVKSTADILALDVEDLLKRRLPTIVASKGLANTVKQARQLVVHKKIIVGDNVVNSPSYIVPVSLESKIRFKEGKKSFKKAAEVESSNDDSENKQEIAAVGGKV